MCRERRGRIHENTKAESKLAQLRIERRLTQAAAKGKPVFVNGKFVPPTRYPYAQPSAICRALYDTA
jgi:hypothetical protein